MFEALSRFAGPDLESRNAVGEHQKMAINPDQLWILNLVLERDPELMKAVTAGILALGANATEFAKTLGTGNDPPEEVSKTAELEPQIIAWFQTHPGRHPISEVRKSLGVELTSKPFKTAVSNLVTSKTLKHNGKRGKGSEYWL